MMAMTTEKQPPSSAAELKELCRGVNAAFSRINSILRVEIARGGSKNHPLQDSITLRNLIINGQLTEPEHYPGHSMVYIRSFSSILSRLEVWHPARRDTHADCTEELVLIRRLAAMLGPYQLEVFSFFSHWVNFYMFGSHSSYPNLLKAWDTKVSPEELMEFWLHEEGGIASLVSEDSSREHYLRTAYRETLEELQVLRIFELAGL